MLIVEICRTAVPRIYEVKSLSEAVRWHDTIHKTDINKWMQERNRFPIFKIDFVEIPRTYDGYSRSIHDDERRAYLERMGDEWRVFIFDGINEAKAEPWPDEIAPIMKRCLSCLESFQRSDVDEDGERSIPFRNW